MPAFVGSGLSLESVSQLALVTLRVKFTQDPLATSSTGANDALNPANYAISGPSVVNVTGVSAVYGDPESFDVFLSVPLTNGTWTLAASNAIQTSSGSAIAPPTSLQVVVSAGASVEPLGAGSENDDALEVIKKFFNPALKGEAWDALLGAVASGEQQNWDNAQAAFRQLFLPTAAGDYLVQRASDQGIDKPKNVGMDDETFRKFALTVTNNKLTEEALLEVLEVFYGSDAVRASDASAAVEPYALQAGDDLVVLIDEKLSVNTVFQTSDFARAGQARAIEVAAALTRSFAYNGSLAFALPVVDSTTGQTAIRIYSPSRGLRSSIRITGGKAQNALGFADQLSLPSSASSSLPTWNVTVDAVRGTMRFSSTGASNLDLSGLQIGDYVNIYGSPFQAENRGSFPVTAVSVTYSGATVTQYFEVSNGLASAQSGVAQLAQADILYFRPARRTVHTSANRAVTVCIPADRVDVKLPATSQAVNRIPKLAAYCQADPLLPITSLTRAAGVVTAVVPSHGMSVGDWFIVEGAIGSITSGGDLNGMRSVATIVDSNTFTFKTETQTASVATGGTILPFRAQASGVPGPFIYDQGSTAAVTSSGSGLLQDIVQGQHYTQISVVDATQFPDKPGYLCVAFGFANETSTIPYLGRLSSTALAIDYSFQFPNDISAGPVVAITAGGTSGSTALTVSALAVAIPAGTSLQLSGGTAQPEIVKTTAFAAAGATSLQVTALASSGRTGGRAALVQVLLLAQKGAYIPENPEELGSFYLTDSAAGRVAAIQTLDDIVGGGLNVNTTVIYPSDRGLANEGAPTSGDGKVSGVVDVFATSEDQ